MTLHLLRATAWRLPRVAPAALAALLAPTAPAHAAGGHHSVDDATILEPGECQLETWADRTTDGSRSSQHLGPGCRVGPVELSLNLDRVRTTNTAAVGGPQLKWAMPLNDTVSVGAAASLSWQDRAPRSASRTAVLLATWQPAEAWLIHANAGRDFRPGEPSSAHAGAAVEWQAAPAWSFVGERFREGGYSAWRVGGRWALTGSVHVDLSRARSLAAGGPTWWTAGLSWVGLR
jgi:hypothetical protein